MVIDDVDHALSVTLPQCVTFFHHPVTGKKIQIRGKITCTTTNVIYLLKCPCGKTYVGRTRQALKTHIAKHRSMIRNGDQKSSSFTFQRGTPQCLHMKISRYRESLHSKMWRYHRKSVTKERTMVDSLSSEPTGLNEEFDIRLIFIIKPREWHLCFAGFSTYEVLWFCNDIWLS